MKPKKFFNNPKAKRVKGQSNIELSLYDMNKQIINQLTPFTEDQIDELKNKIDDFKNRYTDNFFMFLNNEKHYYTIFYQNNTNSNPEFLGLGAAVIQIIKEFGEDIKIMSADDFEDRYEIWLKQNDESSVYILFPYGKGVVDFGSETIL